MDERKVLEAAREVARWQNENAAREAEAERLQGLAAAAWTLRDDARKALSAAYSDLEDAIRSEVQP